MNKHSYVCVKLKNNETIFGAMSGHDDKSVTLLNPMSIENITMKDGQNGIVLSVWNPYIAASSVELPLSFVYHIGELKSEFIKFYGNSRIKDEINSITRRAHYRVEDNEDPEKVQEEMLLEVESLIQLFSVEFGFDLAETLENYGIPLDNKNKIVH